MGKIANRQSPIASVQRTQSTLGGHFAVPTWNEYCTNECQSRDSNRSARNAGSTRTKFCFLGELYDRQRMLALRIAAKTLASDSAITIARFRPSKISQLKGHTAYRREWQIYDAHWRLAGSIDFVARPRLGWGPCHRRLEAVQGPSHQVRGSLWIPLASKL